MVGSWKKRTLFSRRRPGNQETKVGVKCMRDRATCCSGRCQDFRELGLGLAPLPVVSPRPHLRLECKATGLQNYNCCVCHDIYGCLTALTRHNLARPSIQRHILFATRVDSCTRHHVGAAILVPASALHALGFAREACHFLLNRPWLAWPCCSRFHPSDSPVLWRC